MKINVVTRNGNEMELSEEAGFMMRPWLCAARAPFKASREVTPKGWPVFDKDSITRLYCQTEADAIALAGTLNFRAAAYILSPEAADEL